MSGRGEELAPQRHEPAAAVRRARSAGRARHQSSREACAVNGRTHLTQAGNAQASVTFAPWPGTEATLETS